MKCVTCKLKGEILLPSLGKSFCKSCYAKMIERRVRRLATITKILPKGLTIKVKLENSNDKVLHHLLKKKFTHIKPVKSSKQSMPQHTLDELCIKVLKAMFKGEPLPKIKLSLLEVLDEDEIKNYALTQGINYKPVKREGLDLVINKMLKSIKEEHPNTLFSIRQIYRRLKQF